MLRGEVRKGTGSHLRDTDESLGGLAALSPRFPGLESPIELSRAYTRSECYELVS